MAFYFCLFLKKLHWENNGKSAYHKCPFHVDHFSKFLRDLLESACDCFYIKGWDQLVCTEVCISYNMDVSFLVALAFSAYFSRWLQHLARSHMMMSQGSEGTELSNEARSMFLMSLCVGICEEGVALAFICPERSSISGREATNAMFPKQVTSRYLAFSAKSMNEKHVL